VTDDTRRDPLLSIDIKKSIAWARVRRADGVEAVLVGWLFDSETHGKQCVETISELVQDLVAKKLLKKMGATDERPGRHTAVPPSDAG